MSRPRFIVDNNVGKLSVWLRALGYDALFINPIDDSDLVARAVQENRIILTKDRGIMKRRAVTNAQVRALLVEGTDIRDQLIQVIRTYSLNARRRFTRCLECNEPIVQREKHEVIHLLPPHVASVQTDFWQCPSCLRLFWRGSHWQRMSSRIAAALSMAVKSKSDV